MADEIVDLLKIKIEKAKRELPLETVNAIDAVDWRATIIGLRSKYGYTFEQLGDLETETELLLCGLVSGEDYPKELENRLRISKSATNELVSEMNDIVFKKIQEELIKNIERKKIFQRSEASKKNVPNEMKILSSAGIEIVPEKLELTTTPARAGEEKPIESREDMLKKIEKPEAVHPVRSRPLENESATVTSGRPASNGIQSIMEQKLSGSAQIPMVKTDHSLENITKIPNESNQAGTTTKPKVDPYREIPE